MSLDLAVQLLQKLWVVPGPVSGFFAGRFIKRWDYRQERKRLKKALYYELASNIDRIATYQSDLWDRVVNLKPPRIPSLKEWIRKDVYQEALTKYPVLQEFKEGKIFDDFYNALPVVDNKPTETERREASQTLLAWLAAKVKDRTLSGYMLYSAQTERKLRGIPLPPYWTSFWLRLKGRLGIDT